MEKNKKKKCHRLPRKYKKDIQEVEEQRKRVTCCCLFATAHRCLYTHTPIHTHS